MVLIRENSVQQINAALQSISSEVKFLRSNVEKELLIINAFLTLIVENTSNSTLKKEMIKVLKNNAETIDKLINKEKELIQ